MARRTAGDASAPRTRRSAARPSTLRPRAVQQALATRAINRLSYPELLEHTSDPFGDFAAGRYDRLARAELASVGLR